MKDCCYQETLPLLLGVEMIFAHCLNGYGSLSSDGHKKVS